MSRLDDILVYHGLYGRPDDPNDPHDRLSVRGVAAKQQIKDLMLELIGEPVMPPVQVTDIDSLTREELLALMIARGEFKMQTKLRQKVNDL